MQIEISEYAYGLLQEAKEIDSRNCKSISDSDYLAILTADHHMLVEIYAQLETLALSARTSH